MKKLESIIFLHSFAQTISENDLVTKQRFRLFKIITFVSLLVYIAFMIQVAVVLPGKTLVLFLMSLVFLAAFINYFALNYHKKERLAFIITLALWYILIHIDTYYSGGIKNSVNFYLAALILAAYMLLGKTAGIIMTFATILHFAYFYLISIFTDWISYIFMGDSPQLVNLYYYISSTVSMLIVALQSFYIERNKNEVINAIKNGKTELELKNRELINSEAKIASKNKELERKNKELEQFAYVASHDLQEPIRTSSGFAELLQRQYSGRLDEKADKYLSYIIHSSERMNTLIKELLNYSRIGFEEQRVYINCNAVMNEVMADLHNAIAESGAIIRFENLPEINGYAVAIKQLFQNMVSNALKFRRENTAPEIIIKGKLDGRRWNFSITDNGIGIAQEYFDRIFFIFQRLHSRSEYEGSGIGLSHCKKIVELHNGKIWVESTPGTGTTFYFTIALL